MTMEKEKKKVETIYFDGSYDVEVFDWIEEINQKGIRDDDLTEFV